ncbi:MAG TPA: type I pullulanase [Thermotogota bacterium]|nr:type I pullulanase [Thermotogota bacterium]HRW34167.1 type I pullulanase [Thermotogota bacterium]
MNLMHCEWIDRQIIKVTVRYDCQKDKEHPVFIVEKGSDEWVCAISKQEEINGITHYEIRLPHEVSFDDLREKMAVLLVSETKKCSKTRLKKTEIIDIYAAQVKEISFFPGVEGGKSVFRLFSPLAKWAMIKLFDGDQYQQLPMEYDQRGFWYQSFQENFHLKEYRYLLNIEDQIYETIDPFSMALTLNSKRSVFIDANQLEQIDDHFENPDNSCDCVIYETHIRDFTADPEVAFEKRNTYEAFFQPGITLDDGATVGLDHLKELGITHVHILPIQDFKSVDESHESDYNWGYDPVCYSVPEGSYASDRKDPLSRIDGVRTMVKTLHQHAIGVILDVVYNHTFEVDHSIFTHTLPDYAYRWNDDGTLSNGSGCGNEIATERIFMRKYIIDTLRHWVRFYHVDGFRFDLMGLMDQDTMFAIEHELSREKQLILYGEPWTGGLSVLPESKRSTKGFQRGHKIAVFNDDLRNAIKGFPDDDSKGFISSQIGWSDTLLGSMLGSIGYEDDLINFADHPCEQIAYTSCHDNLTLFDKIRKCAPEKNWDEWLTMNRLAAFSVVFTQGMLFLHSGEEFARSKHLHHNTYNLGDVYNAIKWHQKVRYHSLYQYYQQLIDIRKSHPVFRLGKSPALRSRVNLIHRMQGAFAFTIDGRQLDSWNHVMVAMNMTNEDLWFKLPELQSGEGWKITVNPYQAGDSVLGIAKKELQLPERSWYLLYI